jgi:enoyl-CoA hydratase/carnithine racemase
MREMAFAGEKVTPESLENYGFTREVVEKFGQRAAALARRRSVKRIDSHA